MSSLSPKEIFADKPYPKWFVNHPIFNEIKTIKKVFPGIGLPNSQSDTTNDIVDVNTDSAIDLVETINENMGARADSLYAFVNRPGKTVAARKAQGERCLALLNSLIVDPDECESFVSIKGSKATLNLPFDVVIPNEKKPVFRHGESLFRVYNKLNELLTEGKFSTMPALEGIQAFKTFSAGNIPNKKLKVIFSSDGKEGAWDIGTMSSRGIRSCQSWDDGDYNHCTIGSVIDPFVGIIYLTSGEKFNEYGSKMIRRCIVRFVINGKTNKPYILLDRMYPSIDTKVITRFTKFLSSKVGDKFDIQYTDNVDHELIANTYLPLTDIRKRLQTLDSRGGKVQQDYNEVRDSIASYQDSNIKSKAGGAGKDEQKVLFDKNSSKKERKFVKSFQETFGKAIKTIDVNVFTDTIKPVIKRLQGLDKGSFYDGNIAHSIAKMIADEIIASVDKSQFTNSDTYIRRVHYAWFNMRTKILDKVRAKIAREINGQLQFKNKVRAQHIPMMMKGIVPAIDEVMKAKLKEIVAKRQFSGALPLP